MKKIAADKNYRLLKRAGSKEDAGVTHADRMADHLAKINDKAGSPNGTAFLVFDALKDTALISSDCSENLEKHECRQDLDKLYTLTQDALEGMTRFKDIWSKYAEIMFSNMNTINAKLAGEAMAWILVNNLNKGS